MTPDEHPLAFVDGVPEPTKPRPLTVEMIRDALAIMRAMDDVTEYTVGRD